MPNYTDPYQGNLYVIEGQDEIINALRLDLMAEMDAVFVYDAHVKSIEDERVVKVLSKIRDEEKVHIGELTELIYTLLGDTDDLLGEIELHNKGVDEVYGLLEECLKLKTNKKRI